MESDLLKMVKIVQQDPAVETVTGYTGGSGGNGNTINQARLNIELKPLAVRKVSVYDVIERLRPKLNVIRGPGCTCKRTRMCAWAAAAAPRSINSPCAATTSRT